MNSVVTDMYAKKALCAGLGRGDRIEKYSPAVSTSSGVSYAIDRSGDKPRLTVFESDQAQSDVDMSSPVIIEEITAPTRQDTAASDVILIDDSSECVGNPTTTVDKEPTPLVEVASSNCSAQQKLVVNCQHFFYLHRASIKQNSSGFPENQSIC